MKNIAQNFKDRFDAGSDYLDQILDDIVEVATVWLRQGDTLVHFVRFGDGSEMRIYDPDQKIGPCYMSL
jgi:predicted PolB exonuclease-like 3'-5' exonuclease